MAKPVTISSPQNLRGGMNWCSFTFYLKNYEGNKTGLGTIFLNIVLNKKRSRISTGIKVPLKLWDSVNQRCKGNTQESHSLNTMIESEKSRIINILLGMEINGSPKTITHFKDRYVSKLKTTCFLRFMAEHSLERCNAGEISDSTYKHTKSILGKIRLFVKTSTFDIHNIDHEWLANYRRYVIKEIYRKKKGSANAPTAENTASNHIKKIATYVNIAFRKGYIDHNPCVGFKLNIVHSQRIFLSKKQFLILLNFYRSGEYQKRSSASCATKLGVLRNFLLMCVTGMRVSDTKHVTKSNIKEGVLTYVAKKTKRQNKEVRIPINPIAEEIIDSIQGNNIFYKLSDQKQNSYLKEVALDAGLNVLLTNHVARHTFGTIFLERGGKVEVLQDLLAHTDIKTTMRYIHMVESEKINQVKKAFDF